MSSDIEELRASQQAVFIDLYFFDESGFSLQPTVPYACQLKRQTIEIFTTRSNYLSVLGFLSIQQHLESFIARRSIDTEVMIVCFEAFSENLNKPTWDILDNVPQHTSCAFKAKIPEWEKRNLFIQYLAAYSPEFN